jgi:hypothetical protein
MTCSGLLERGSQRGRDRDVVGVRDGQVAREAPRVLGHQASLAADLNTLEVRMHFGQAPDRARIHRVVVRVDAHVAVTAETDALVPAEAERCGGQRPLATRSSGPARRTSRTSRCDIRRCPWTRNPEAARAPAWWRACP